MGAGAGSISHWLGRYVGPTGHVVSVDLSTDHLLERPGVEVHRHDINDGLPTDGPFDLIHARLLLLHLPRRRQILRSLVDALAPGGWLVLGEFTGRENRVLWATTEDDRKLFERVQRIAHTVVGTARGVSLEWARMADSGLVHIHSQERSRTTTGGTTGRMLHRNLALQAKPLLLAAGLTEIELKRYCDLMQDPHFRAWFFQTSVSLCSRMSGICWAPHRTMPWDANCPNAPLTTWLFAVRRIGIVSRSSETYARFMRGPHKLCSHPGCREWATYVGDITCRLQQIGRPGLYCLEPGAGGDGGGGDHVLQDSRTAECGT
ncbi:class I SAM-dependent methyltransferase [Nonomuraea sp. K274]|uniref:Class I SAM-dependent methyltransferase n=1 Tax=Nonomuraea cypriaca TaxID=1187855 RepID=A0A931ACZ0_9ACTN|nr:class I SAM-dependent methyltransferase [Nonomuraea cypriaca]MBF8190692.1 class I SAM-dependent methyltransferase [Nonomuraea cypriaca]